MTQICSAAIINVPTDQPTIQAGIDAAVNGDTVLVAAGVYTGDGNRDMDFGGKLIVVKSELGSAVTTINCEGTETERHRAFRFGNSEDRSAVVDGFTFTNGTGQWEWDAYNQVQPYNNDTYVGYRPQITSVYEEYEGIAD